MIKPKFNIFVAQEQLEKCQNCFFFVYVLQVVSFVSFLDATQTPSMNQTFK